MKKKIMGKTRKAAKRPTNLMEIDDFDAASDSAGSEVQEIKKPRVKKAAGDKARKPKKVADLSNSVNFMKVNNKLIGAIENNDLYNSDDNIVRDDGISAARQTNDVDRNQTLEFGNESQDKKTDNKFFMKMKTRKL